MFHETWICVIFKVVLKAIFYFLCVKFQLDVILWMECHCLFIVEAKRKGDKLFPYCSI